MAVAGAALLMAAPAAAAGSEFVKPLAWYPEEPELRAAVPTSVEFEDVAAAQGGVALAVGTDAATGEPVIYGRTSAGWQHAPTAVPLPAEGRLTDVDLDATGATGWAVGEANGQPLVLELVDGVWTDRSATAALPAVPTAVALAGAGAVIGDENGHLHAIAPDGTVADSQEALGAGAINGIALFSDSEGLAVAGYEPLAGLPAEEGVRIYDIGDDGPVLDANERARDAETHMTGLAAVSPLNALAIDSTHATWRLTRALGQNDWIQEASPTVGEGESPALAAVASVARGPAPFDGDGWATEFVAGSTGVEEGPQAGALWHRTRWRTDAKEWTRASLPAGMPALTGVAATAWDSAWAVGAGGTILRYWRPPDPEAEEAARQAEEQRRLEEQQRTETTTASTTTATTTQEEPVQPADDDTSADGSVNQWRPSDSPPPPEPDEDRFLTNGIVVKDGKRRARRPKRLVKNVRAAIRRSRTGRRQLVVRFRLTRRARVHVAAKRGRKVVGKTPARTLRRGRRKVVMRFRGRKPPTKLKLVARPARKANGDQNRTQSRRTQ